MNKKKIAISLAVILTVVSHYFLKYFFAYVVLGKENYNSLQPWTQTILIQVSGLFLCFLTVSFLGSFKLNKMKEMMGFKGILRPFLFALTATVPMFIGYALMNGLHPTSFNNIVWYSLWPGFNEELVYRAFMVGILVRYAGWNFILAALLSGLFFASGHLYQANSLWDAVEIFLFTAGAGIGFAIFYKLWNWNIWFTMFLHVFMNLAWVLFIFSGTALMSKTENIYRFTTIIIAIILTIIQWKGGKRISDGELPDMNIAHPISEATKQ